MHTGEKMLVKKSMHEPGKTDGFYGIGFEPFITEKEMGYNVLLQTEKKLIRINDCGIGALADPTYPDGTMVMVQANSAYKFSNGKIVPVPPKSGFAADAFPAPLNKLDVYGTDSGHVVIIPHTVEDNLQEKIAKKAYIDYTVTLEYPVEINQKNLLIATNPAKSVFYKNHHLYFPDGHSETIYNVGDAQIYRFNGKDYLVWFEMLKIADGHEVYVCGEELK